MIMECSHRNTIAIINLIEKALESSFLENYWERESCIGRDMNRKMKSHRPQLASDA